MSGPSGCFLRVRGAELCHRSLSRPVQPPPQSSRHSCVSRGASCGHLTLRGWEGSRFPASLTWLATQPLSLSPPRLVLKHLCFPSSLASLPVPHVFLVQPAPPCTPGPQPKPMSRDREKGVCHACGFTSSSQAWDTDRECDLHRIGGKLELRSQSLQRQSRDPNPGRLRLRNCSGSHSSWVAERGWKQHLTLHVCWPASPAGTLGVLSLCSV